MRDILCETRGLVRLSHLSNNGVAHTIRVDTYTIRTLVGCCRPPKTRGIVRRLRSLNANKPYVLSLISATAHLSGVSICGSQLLAAWTRQTRTVRGTTDTVVQFGPVICGQCSMYLSGLDSGEELDSFVHVVDAVVDEHVGKPNEPSSRARRA